MILTAKTWWLGGGEDSDGRFRRNGHLQVGVHVLDTAWLRAVLSMVTVSRP
jgi:hypothetical protein